MLITFHTHEENVDTSPPNHLHKNKTLLFPMDINHKANIFQLQQHFFIIKLQKMSNTKSQSSSSYIPKEMGAKPPVNIGTKGTVGLLIRQEIEYFNKLEVHSRNHSLQVQESAQSRTSARRKKRFIPSICSAIEVENSNGPKMISRLKVTKTRQDS